MDLNGWVYQALLRAGYSPSQAVELIRELVRDELHRVADWMDEACPEVNGCLAECMCDKADACRDVAMLFFKEELDE